MALAPGMTREELEFLRDQQLSEQIRIVKKRLEWLYSIEATKMATSVSDPTAVFRQQGVMQGILSSISHLTAYELTDQKKK